MKPILTLLACTIGLATFLSAAQPSDHLIFPGLKGQPGSGKHVVLISGDEEYRSEESMPMMAQLLNKHGFNCSVLFSMDKDNKFVNPDNVGSLSNIQSLDSADLIILDTRMRKWNDAAMAKFSAAWQRGVPITALRTATHPFAHGADSKWHKWAFNYEGTDWPGGFGKQVLGETWISHWGAHGREGTRTYPVEENKNHPVLNGVGTIFCRTDLYEAYPLDPSTILLEGQITKTLERDSEDLTTGKGATRMPVAWTRLYKHHSGKTNRIFTTTMGSADDLADKNLRRLVINSVYWGLGLKVPERANAELSKTYEPTFFGFGRYRKEKTPSDFISVLSPETERAMKFENIKGKSGETRFVRIDLPGNPRILTLVEVEVISGGNNIAPKGIPKQINTFQHGSAGKAIDGGKSEIWAHAQMTHTADANGGVDTPWWEIDLRDGYDISAIRVYNRSESLGTRLDGFRVTLLNKDRRQLFQRAKILAPTKAIEISIVDSKLKYSDGTASGKTPVEPIAGPKFSPVVKNFPPRSLRLQKGSRLAFVGGGFGSRMNIYNEFETELYRRFPELDLVIRNLCKEGDTPAFRPHPSRKYHTVLDSLPDRGKSLVPKRFQVTRGQQGDGWGSENPGHYETPDQWLERLGIDTVIGFFGYTESFEGPDDLPRYKEELRAFINHTLKQPYTLNGPQLAIVGPAAFEDLSATKHLPDGKEINRNLETYTAAMKEVCREEGVLFVDAFSITQILLASTVEDQTINGHNYTPEAYQAIAPKLADALFSKMPTVAPGKATDIKAAITEKNRLWLSDYKMPNGVHAHGRRYRPFGNVNYPHEFRKIREMTTIRDQLIWETVNGRTITSQQLAAADAKTHPLPEVGTNSNRPVAYKSGKEVEGLLKMAPGYKVELFACEDRFPDLQNPSQMAFDNHGRLWVGCMSAYPHHQVGAPLANDKILIFEDTNNDGRADRQVTFVDKIHIPMGFEITEHGVFVSLGNDLVLFQDTDGDDKADKKTIVISGFDDHDTHHAISSFCGDPSGAIYMGEGVFSFSNVETPYGTVRGTNGGFYRYNPNRGRLERTAQYSIPNPWGIAFNDWGQNFFLHTSGVAMSWMQQGAVKPTYNINLSAPNILGSNAVRPTSGLEFVSSRHFPDEVQGDVILCNTIGFLGAKQHSVQDDSESGFFKVDFRHDLFKSDSSYQYFRPVDLEFAPDGSLYFIDWSNVLIGHMQHSARDPKRDHQHGRVYRVTYPSRPLVPIAKVAGASIDTLLENLKLPEIRTRYRTRRELRGRDHDQVETAVKAWTSRLNPNDPRYEHHLLEALWVLWGIERVEKTLVDFLLKAKDYRARTAAVRVVRYNADKLGSDVANYLLAAAADDHPQVRHEALIAATWVNPDIGFAVIKEFEKKPISNWSKQAYNACKGLEPKKVKFDSGLLYDRENETKIAINAKQGLQFDIKKLDLKVGKKITLVFGNPDELQHNLLVVKPGTASAVAAKAVALGSEGFAKQWVPEDDNVIAASKLVNHNEKDTLTFTFTEPGEYQFVCTFPGHDQMMRGIFSVK
ncbi:MAG: PVC-type heme-binding CxxCH protein [Akkermansiaceae bacterium]